MHGVSMMKAQMDIAHVEWLDGNEHSSTIVWAYGDVVWKISCTIGCLCATQINKDEMNSQAQTLAQCDCLCLLNTRSLFLLCFILRQFFDVVSVPIIDLSQHTWRGLMAFGCGFSSARHYNAHNLPFDFHQSSIAFHPISSSRYTIPTHTSNFLSIFPSTSPLKLSWTLILELHAHIILHTITYTSRIATICDWWLLMRGIC